MPRMLRGETVVVARPTAGAMDAHGNLVPGGTESECVERVLPQPGGTEFLSASRPEGARVDMTFHFPKGYAGPSLKGAVILRGGRRYAVIGDPQPFPAANCPTPWSMAVECEACDG